MKALGQRSQMLAATIGEGGGRVVVGRKRPIEALKHWSCVRSSMAASPVVLLGQDTLSPCEEHDHFTKHRWCPWGEQDEPDRTLRHDSSVGRRGDEVPQILQVRTYVPPP